MTFRRHLALLALLSIAVSCGGDGRRPLVVYSAHARDILAEFEAGFEKAHPEVDVRTIYLGSNEIFERLRAERTNAQCDVWWGGDLTAMTSAADEKLLAPYTPSFAAENVPHDAEWRFSACFVLPMVLGYHPARIKPEELPRTFAALAEPRFKDRLVLREPAASGTMRTLIGGLVARELAAGRSENSGFELWRGVHRNVVNYEGKPELLFEALERGPAAITIWNLTDLLFQHQEKGYKFLPAPLDEPVPATLDGIALTTRAAHNQDAADFYEYVNSLDSLRDLATRHWRIPVRPTFDRAGLRPEIRDFKWTRLELDARLMADKSAGWMRRFEEEIRAQGAPKK